MKNFDAFLIAIFTVACGGQVDQDHVRNMAGDPVEQETSRQTDERDADARELPDPSGEAGAPSVGGSTGAAGSSTSGGADSRPSTGGIRIGGAGTDEAGGSGGISSDGGNSAAGSAGNGTVPSCEPSLWVAVSSYEEGDIDLGSRNIPMLFLDVTAGECEDILIHTLDLVLMSPDAEDYMDSSLYCREPCEAPDDWNFTNVTVRAPDNQLWGPIPFERYQMESSPDDFVTKAIFVVGDNAEYALTVPAGQTSQLVVSMDITAVEAVPIVRYRFWISLAGFGAHSESTVFVEAEFEEMPPERYITITDSDGLRDAEG